MTYSNYAIRANVLEYNEELYPKNRFELIRALKLD